MHVDSLTPSIIFQNIMYFSNPTCVHQKCDLQNRVQSIPDLGNFFCYLWYPCVTVSLLIRHQYCTVKRNVLFTNRRTWAINIYLENGK